LTHGICAVHLFAQVFVIGLDQEAAQRKPEFDADGFRQLAEQMFGAASKSTGTHTFASEPQPAAGALAHTSISGAIDYSI
jgi:hypothetical protein